MYLPKLPLWKERKKKELALSTAWVERRGPGVWETSGDAESKGIKMKYPLYRYLFINIHLNVLMKNIYLTFLCYQI